MISIVLGTKQVVKGLDQAIIGMQAGATKTVSAANPDQSRSEIDWQKIVNIALGGCAARVGIWRYWHSRWSDSSKFYLGVQDRARADW